MKLPFKIFLLLSLPFFLFGEDFTPIIQEHVAQLKYLDEKHDPLWVLFSGTPGMGKSTIARLLEDEFHGVRITSDDGRNLLRKHGISPEQKNPESGQPWIADYLLALSEYLQTHSSNQLIILDKSVDRTFKQVSGYTAERNIPIFLVRLQLPPEEIEERIRLYKENPERYLTFSSKWWNDYQNFDVSNVDYNLSTSGKLEDLDLFSLFDAIQEKVGTPMRPQETS